MEMARNAAKLIKENLRFPSGEKVECVIADTNIGGVAETNVFRPALWTSFGTNKEGQDYRVCKAYGSLYGI